MTTKNKSTFILTILLFVSLALVIVYMVDYQIREVAYRQDQIDETLLRRKDELGDEWNRNLSLIQSDLETVVQAFQTEGYPFADEDWGDSLIPYHDWAVYPTEDIPLDISFLWNSGQIYEANGQVIRIFKALGTEGLLVVTLDTEDIATYVLPYLSSKPEYQEFVLSATGSILYGSYAHIDEWVSQVNFESITYRNFTTFVTIQKNVSFSYREDNQAYYGYVTPLGTGLYVLTTTTEEAFQIIYGPTERMLHTSFTRSLIVLILLTTYVVSYEIILQRRLKKSRLQLTALSTSSSGGIVVVGFDETLPIKFGNEGFYQALGYTEKEMRDKFDMQLSRMIYEKDIAFCENVITHLKTHEKGDFKIRLKAKYRGLIWVHLNCSHHLDHEDSITMVMLDITESKNLNTEIKSLIATIPGGVLKTTVDNWKIIFASDSLAKLLGYTPSEFKEKFTYFNECVDNQDLAYYLEAIGQQPDTLYLELRLHKKDQTTVWTMINATKTLHEDNESIYQSVVLDATHQKEVSIELKKELDRSTVVMEMIDEFICEYFVNEDRLISSHRCAETLGIDLIVNDFKKRVFETELIHPDDMASFLEYYENWDESQKEYRMDLRIRHPHGEYVWYLLKSATLYEGGVPYKIIVKLTDINEEKNKINSLLDISVRDAFTGVYNSGNIPHFINQFLKEQNNTLSHALLMIDIDNFKHVNDSYGHDVGDKLIKEYSARIVAFFGSGGIVGRVGGDEFVVLIKDIDEAKVVGYVEKLRRKLLEEYRFDHRVITFSTSFGISLYPKDGKEYHTLFKKADIACYEAKGHGKNTIRQFSDEMMLTQNNLTTIRLDSTESNNLMMECLEILGGREKVIEGIQEVLDKISDFYNFDGALFFEYMGGEHRFMYTMGYQREPSSLIDHQLESEPYVINSFLMQKLLNEALLFLNDPETIRSDFESLYQLLKAGDYRSGLLCSIQEMGQMRAMIVFTSRKTIDYPKSQDVTTLVTTARVIMGYVNRVREKQKQSTDSFVVEEILKQKEVNAYVVDEETHELTYISPQLAEEFPHVKMQEVCYRALKGLDAICENCPLHLLEKNRSATTHQFDELSHRWMRLSANRINWKDSPHNHALICNYDITSTIENVTLIDPLTGIANLTKFMIEGGKRLKATPNRSYAVVYADINDFRYINQVHGYEIGNAILREVAAILEDGMRRDELCAHINGDRFVLLLKYVNQTNLKKRLFQLSEQFTEIKNRFVGTVNITASSGVYVIPEDQNDITKAINNAELAHKKAKASKHTPIVFHEESLMKELALVKAIENKMQHALDHDEFLLYMQPKYDTHTNTISGLESLTRWKYDENRILGPGDFIPIFEKNGFINRMTHHMAEKVFQTIRGWIDNRLIVVPIAINISYNYLISDYFCNDFIDLLKRYKIPPQLIEIELTETIFKEDVGIILEQMIRMKNLGFKIAIDDFGSGYSSLILLRDLPVDILKLDKGFFKNDVVGKKEMVIIENIVHMAQELGIDIVSEGVESEEQLKFLSKIGCHYVQGYYFARPMDVDQAIELLNQKKGEI